VASVLELDVSSAGTPGKYKVDVIQSPAGEASATFELEPAQFIDRLDGLQQTLLASSVPSRRLLSRGETSVRDVGRRLFDALFSQQAVAGVYRASSAVAAERGEALRIVLRMSAPELAVLPWESMYDAAGDNYVARREPLVRYLPVPSSPPPLKVRLPLKILAPIASPRGLALLDVEKERNNLTQALRPLLERGAVVVQWLGHATWPALQDTLLSDSWHIVHFIGHGDFDIERDEGVLALETEQGQVHRVPAGSFVDLLREAQPMPRLVVLNACESSTSGQTDLFSGTAAALVRGGVSAVSAMQFEISDQAAIAFCRGFYTAIGRARGVDEAVRSGRVAIVGLGEGSLEWITPTLYLRGKENHLFALSDSPPETVVAEQRNRTAAVEERDPAEAARAEAARAEGARIHPLLGPVLLGLLAASGALVLVARLVVFERVNGYNAAQAGFATLPWVLGVAIPLVAAVQLLLVRRRLPWAVALAVGLVAGAMLVQLDQVLVTAAFLLDADTGFGAGPGWWLALLGTLLLGAVVAVVAYRPPFRERRGVQRSWRAASAVVVLVGALILWLLARRGFYLWFPANVAGFLILAVALPVVILVLNHMQRLAGLAAVTVYGGWVATGIVVDLFAGTYWSEPSRGIAAVMAVVCSGAACYVAQIGADRRSARQVHSR
jgi:hypothetical protein